MSPKTPMLVITDETGKVVAAAHEAQSAKREISVGLSPLQGQRLYRVELPEEIARLTSGHDFELALSRLMVKPEPIKAEIRKLAIKRKEVEKRVNPGKK